MKIIYRISDSGYNKVKPDYINNKNCLENASKVFSDCDWHIIADNISNQTNEMINQLCGGKGTFSLVNVGHGAGTFNIALDEALKLDDEEIVYFLENDYLHREGSNKIIEDALNMGADFCTLYLHPDRFIIPNKGGNPLVESDGGQVTKLFRGKSSFFSLQDSTTMTFACKVGTLRKCESILRKHTNTKHPNDMQMFHELRSEGYSLVCPIPTFSTHGETNWLAPLIGTEFESLSTIDGWKKIIGG